ncbi:hypothetical protein MMC13_007662 [Lambiella insularis]|nr:hypothetical protein [Lambiella insularis]
MAPSKNDPGPSINRLFEVSKRVDHVQGRRPGYRATKVASASRAPHRYGSPYASLEINGKVLKKIHTAALARSYKAFNILPLETIQHIASYLPKDRDMCNLQQTCRQAYAAINPAMSGVWRRRFMQTYDVSQLTSSKELKKIYIYRQQFMRSIDRRPFEVNACHGLSERLAVRFITKLISDSLKALPSADVERSVPFNVKEIEKIVGKTGILNNTFRSREGSEGIHEKAQLVRLVLAHLQLRAIPINAYCFEFSQQAVYGHPRDFPIFLDGFNRKKINTNYLLHIVNFFKYHITNEEEVTLFHPFAHLEADERPQSWDSLTGLGLQKLGTHWKGTYAYLDNQNLSITMIRLLTPGRNYHQDDLDIDLHDDGFSSLHLDFSRPSTHWPAAFERHLSALPSAASATGAGPASSSKTTKPPKPKSGIDYHQFQGHGYGAGKFRCAGTVTALPPQGPNGLIPGFQRITMMKWFDASDQDNPFFPTDDHLDTSSQQSSIVEDFLQLMSLVGDLRNVDVDAWAYEGIVLPGGKIMLGRWWAPVETPEHDLEDPQRELLPAPSAKACPPHMLERRSTGPWIFWNVDGAARVRECEDC